MIRAGAQRKRGRIASMTASTTAASDANRCSERIHRPLHAWPVIAAVDSYGVPIR